MILWSLFSYHHYFQDESLFSMIGWKEIAHKSVHTLFSLPFFPPCMIEAYMKTTGWREEEYLCWEDVMIVWFCNCFSVAFCLKSWSDQTQRYRYYWEFSDLTLPLFKAVTKLIFYMKTLIKFFSLKVYEHRSAKILGQETRHWCSVFFLLV